MKTSRQGGTNGKMRDKRDKNGQLLEAANRDDDIRGSIVQAFLKDFAGEGKICWAIPINTTLYDKESLWELVKNTRLHESDHQDAVFSLSVKLVPYSCNIISCWVYIAIIR